MRIRIVLLVLLCSLFLLGTDFDFKAYSKKKFQPEEAKVLIEEFQPTNNVDRFKRSIIMHFCYFYKEKESLEYLYESIEIAKIMNEKESEECAGYMCLLGKPEGILDSYLPSSLSYNDIENKTDYILKVFDLRASICSLLRSVKFGNQEKVRLQNFRKDVFELKYHNEIMLSLIDKVANMQTSEIVPFGDVKEQQ